MSPRADGRGSGSRLRVHLVDGTYELFRHHFALPPHEDRGGRNVAAVRGVVGSLLSMMRDGATHVGVATDHVIESFRNELWDGYKTGEGMDPELGEQFGPLEDALGALGVALWPMVEFEADDALASAAAVAAADRRVDRVFVCTPDKDLAQVVAGDRVVQLDRRSGTVRDEAGVRERFGVPPPSIPDWLALVGDASDGYPGIAGFGARGAAAVLGRFGHVERIPDDPAEWRIPGLRGAERLAATLARDRDLAMLFVRLATLRRDAPVGSSVDDWRWKGPSREFERMAEHLRAPELARRAEQLG